MSNEVLEKILKNRRSQPQQLVEVLQDVQEAFGYVPQEAMTTVSRELGVPLIEVSRVAHFYKAFSLKPRGKHVVTVCLGTACHVRGGSKILEEFERKLGLKAGETTADKKFTLETVACLGCCAIGPVVVVEGDYHRHTTIPKVGTILKKYQRGKKPEATTQVAKHA